MNFTNELIFDFLFESLSNQSFYESSSKKIENSESDFLSKIDDLFHDRSHRIVSSILFSTSKKNENLKNLLNIVEFNVTKTKKRSREFKNKKIMTRTKKKIVKFTKKDFSKFEHVKRNIEIKRVKKKFADEITRTREKRDKNEERREKKTS